MNISHFILMYQGARHRARQECRRAQQPEASQAPQTGEGDVPRVVPCGTAHSTWPRD